ncbi:hypothetical protein F521_13305 [Enterococcus hirae 67-03-C5]|nr:hypothetical protein F521_13305 [Enterococcus hirae 67-03-C5]
MFQAIAFETERLKFCAATPNDINIIRDNYLSEKYGYQDQIIYSILDSEWRRKNNLFLRKKGVYKIL